MNIIVAIDSFKGSLTSLQAGSAAEQGILRALPQSREFSVRCRTQLYPSSRWQTVEKEPWLLWYPVLRENM